ncbi:serine protease inhibitor 2.1-like [Penaeus japonicus]|uniref:serine protease inhibitor 2.1-like n=1 Tax=Penaeus japonicus TaxID=27405 RepID=UPI001C711F49|nr:serine protease inhibitor 2.1-like [Penaeus japonicus]
MAASASLAVLLMLTLTPRCVNAQCFSAHDDLTSMQTYHDISGMVSFAFDLFRELLDRTPQEGNLFFSPYSVWNGLVLAYLGAEGKTRQEMEQVMGVRNKVSTLKTWWLLEHMYKANRVKNSFNTFVLANRVYVDARVPLSACAADILKDQLQVVNFLKYHDATSAINKHTFESTLGLIPTVVTEREIYQAIMVMVNVAAFKGLWRHQFRLNDTYYGNFFVTPEKYVRVPMMKQEGQFRNAISRELGAQVIELPYAQGPFTMYIFKPNNGVKDLLSRLNPASFRTAITNMWHHQVTVHLPRFNMHSSIKGDLKLALYKLGIRELFSESADLTTLAPRGSLVVSRTFHQAALQVTEEGTEAAAATVFVSLSRTKPPPPASFVCDRPFVFVIYDSQTGNFVFVGVFRNPAA